MMSREPAEPVLRRLRSEPVLATSEDLWECPVSGRAVAWKSHAVFNPAAVVHAESTVLLYRAQGPDLVSRLGLAWSRDGVEFRTEPEPVLFPDADEFAVYERPRGCEDPRLIRSEGGDYILTYTAYDGTTARLCVATSKDLRTWQKHGPAFALAHQGRYLDVWSKAGSIVGRREGESIVATRILGRYWMYWNDLQMHVATSDDLIHWEPLEDPQTPHGLRCREGTEQLRVVLPTRHGSFDSALVEPGAPAVIEDGRIWLVYNARNDHRFGDRALPDLTYFLAVAEFDESDPTRLIARSAEPMLSPSEEYERTGQVNDVVFTEGMVPATGGWRLYYGAGDSAVGVAQLDFNQP